MKYRLTMFALAAVGVAVASAVPVWPFNNRAFPSNPALRQDQSLPGHHSYPGYRIHSDPTMDAMERGQFGSSYDAEYGSTDANTAFDQIQSTLPSNLHDDFTVTVD
jgi:hypothetical protein